MEKESNQTIPKHGIFYDIAALIKEMMEEKRELEEIESTEIPEEESTRGVANPCKPTPESE